MQNIENTFHPCKWFRQMNLKKKKQKNTSIFAFWKKNQRIFHPSFADGRIHPWPGFINNSHLPSTSKLLCSIHVIPGRLESRLPPPLMDRRECTVQSPSEAQENHQTDMEDEAMWVSTNMKKEGWTGVNLSWCWYWLINAVLGFF